MKLPVLREASPTGAVTSESTVMLESLVGAISRLQEVVDSWPEETQRNTVTALITSLEELHKEAIVRIIREVKSDSGGALRLRDAARDEVVYAVLRRLGVLKPSLPERLDRALATVRPMLAQHNGDVELVSIDSPTAVTIRLLGACDGCPASGLTLREGVEKAIHDECPEIDKVSVARGSGIGTGNVSFISPFAREGDAGWLLAASLDDIAVERVKVVVLADRQVILWRTDDGKLAAYDNMCAHLGMPLDGGLVADGILTCPHHGFRYLLESGECLTAPQAQLVTHAVRVSGERVEVKLL